MSPVWKLSLKLKKSGKRLLSKEQFTCYTQGRIYISNLRSKYDN
jgi:hypothetical protein